jgi:acetamidase/formamidase
MSARHQLAASRETTAVGRFENGRSPVLSIASGDTVFVQTLNHYGDQVAPTTSLAELVTLRKESGSCGPHTVTGPIFVEGAIAGDSLAIQIGKISPRNHGYNFNLPGKDFPSIGALPEDFPEGQLRHFALDPHSNEIVFEPDIRIPVKPFPGIIAVSPPDYATLSTIEPGEFGGNMDLKELTSGSVLYLPVFVNGALVWVGDAHAAQGNGEVNLTAVECAFDSIELTIRVLKDIRLAQPRAETATHWITLGFHPDLDEAFRRALRDMILFITTEKRLSRLDAYSLCSLAVDFHITQVVDGSKGVHAMLPKSIFMRQ